MRRITPALCAARAALCFAALCVASEAALAARHAQAPGLAPGARVGIVNLLDAEVTHFHAARQVQDSFLKTYKVSWPVNAMLLAALTEGLTKAGLRAVPAAATEDRSRVREECFLNAELARGLPKNCAALLAKLAGAEHLDALIVLGPGLNDGARAGRGRHTELPEYLRGWCVVSGQRANSAPLLLNFTQLVLISVPAEGPVLIGRETGGEAQSWPDYQAPADLKAMKEEQIDPLRPAFAAMLKQQADALLAHLQAAH